MPTSKTTYPLIWLLYPSIKILFYSTFLQLPHLKNYLDISMVSFFKTHVEPGGRNTNSKRENSGEIWLVCLQYVWLECLSQGHRNTAKEIQIGSFH